MNTTVSLDRPGRVVIPKALRDELRLGPGDLVEMASDGELVTLRPIRTESRVSRARGVWVFDGSRKISAAVTNQMLRDIRAERDRSQRAPDR